MRVLFGAFLIAHGLVYALYAGHARGLFEVKPGMTWPDGSWALSGPLGDAAVRWLVVAVLLLTAVLFAVSGVGVMFRQPWWVFAATLAAAVSTAILLLAWNGRLENLDGQGAYAILINIAVVVAAQVLHWPSITE